MDPHVPPLDRLLRIMARLRDPQGGCPWDLEQDFSTIAPYTIEEAYEVADAIDRNDLGALKDELGDLLLQVVFHAQMASEQGAFGFDDVAGAIGDKMVRRHPHVFGDASFADAEEQTRNWEAIKRAEREAAGEADRSALAGISRGLPEWQRAVKAAIARGPHRFRLARAGAGDRQAARGNRGSPRRVRPWRRGINRARLEDEIGDLLFVAANLARHAKVDVGAALRHANHKFERRFRAMEQLAEADGTPLPTLALDQQDAYWNRAKRIERGQAD